MISGLISFAVYSRTALAAAIMMAASCATSRRALSWTTRYVTVAASARPTTNAANSTRLHFILKPIGRPLPSGPDHGDARQSNPGGASTAVDQPRRLIRCQASGHFATDLVLEAPNGRAALGTENTVDETVIVAETKQRVLHPFAVLIRHPRFVGQSNGLCLWSDGNRSRRDRWWGDRRRGDRRRHESGRRFRFGGRRIPNQKAGADRHVRGNGRRLAAGQFRLNCIQHRIGFQSRPGKRRNDRGRERGGSGARRRLSRRDDADRS